MTNGLDILAQTIVSGNVVLVQGLGLYALTRYTKDVQTAAKAGLTTLIGLILGSLLLWLCGGFIPSQPAAQVGFYLVVGLMAALWAPVLLRQESTLEDKVVDSALVGTLLLLGREGAVGVQNVWLGLGAGVGYLLVLMVMTTIRRRLELAPVPKALRGTPILLLTAGLLAIALLGFRF